MENNQDNVILNGEPATNENSQPKSNNPQNGTPVNPCPVCGTSYTYVCPKCGFSPYVGNKKAKKSIFTKWWFWLVAVVLVFGIMIGSASCMFMFMSNDMKETSNYAATPLCTVGDIEVKLVPEKCYRDIYSINIVVEVKNKGDEKVAFYPNKAMFDGRSTIAYCDFSLEDTEFMWDYDSYYAEDESLILKPGKRHLIEITFDGFYDDGGESTDDDFRNFSNLDITFNIANPETLRVLESNYVNVDLTKLEAKKKYYDQQ